MRQIITLVENGLETTERLDLAARRLLVPLFRMGLFENPYVQASDANSVLSSTRHAETALDVQRRSAVLLENHDRADGTGPALPLRGGSTVYVLGKIDTGMLTDRGFTVIDG